MKKIISFTLIFILSFSNFLFYTNVMAKQHISNIDIYRTQEKLSENPVTSSYAMNCIFRQNNMEKTIILAEVIELTLCNNPQTKQAWAFAKMHAAQLGIAKSSYLPTLQTSYSYTRDSGDNYFKNDSKFKNNEQTRKFLLDASWLLFDFGKRKDKVNQAQFLLAYAYANQNDVLQETFLKAVQAYYNLASIQGILTVNIEAQEEARQNYLAAKARYKAGVSTLADQLQAETNYAKAISARIKAQGEVQIAKGELAILMGLAVNTPYDIQTEFPQSPDELLASVDDLLKKAQQTHPKLLAVKAQVSAAKAALNVVKKEGLPSIYFISTAESTRNNGTSLSSLNENNNINWGVRLTVPLFEGYSRQYRIKHAQAELDSKSAELEQVEQQINLNVWKNYYNLITESDNIKVVNMLEDSAIQSYQVTQGRYRAGVSSMLELMNAQNELANAKQQKNAIYSQWQVARMQLLASLGELDLWDLKSK
ncbi:TolC family protein [Acinetobacter bereziniae]|uniref:TolC family protein n=1 Tax=Acinetobacter bereziniae TaxID=106648 RepID=UPI00124FAED5|nr:TolC family protein [Acinetobacter bereziniae]MCU4315052.1 TolC family protein [Acinetobacter bereziniae]